MPLQRFWKNSIGKIRLQQVLATAIECQELNMQLLRRRIVERVSQEEVTVDYANDLDTKK